jgi:transposase
LLDWLKGHGFGKARGRQRTDSPHVLAAIPVLNRPECVAETLRHARNVLATGAPDWLPSRVPTDWFDRYSQRLQDDRLPKGREAREALAAQIGADGRSFLAVPGDPQAPVGLNQVPAIRTLRRVWLEQYPAGKPIRWREAANLPPAGVMIRSPDDAEARYSIKRETVWTGSKIPLTETCDDDRPNLITDVAATPAPRPDHAVTRDSGPLGRPRSPAAGASPRYRFRDCRSLGHEPRRSRD